MKNNWKELVILIKKTAEEKGITHQHIADATGFKQPNICRILGLKMAPRIDTLAKVADVVGVKLAIKKNSIK